MHGRLEAGLNGEKLFAGESADPCHVGQFKVPVELGGGENRLTFRVSAPDGAPRLSALLTGPRNDGDTMEGIRYLV